MKKAIKLAVNDINTEMYLTLMQMSKFMNVIDITNEEEVYFMNYVYLKDAYNTDKDLSLSSKDMIIRHSDNSTQNIYFKCDFIVKQSVVERALIRLKYYDFDKKIFSKGNKHMWLRYQPSNKKIISASLTGADAYRILKQTCEKKKVDIEERANHFQGSMERYYRLPVREKNDNSIDVEVKKMCQFHCLPITQLPNNIKLYQNCRYYDINKTYNYFLGEAIPEIKDTLYKWGHLGSKNPKYKNLVNFAVGYLGKEGKETRSLFEWIVTQCRIKMDSFIENSQMGNNILYGNTDGVIFKNCYNKVIESSDEIGEWSEHIIDDGLVWYYRHMGEINYAVLQWFENGKKVIKCLGGISILNAYKYIDLREGEIYNGNTK